MERIRSAALEPFDYDRANMSDELWFGEGFTSYYASLFIARAGLMDPEQYVSGLVGTLNTVVNGPGRQYGSPVEMSRMAPFWDAATSIDPTNQQNTFISYYTWGAAIGLGLDLTLRTRFDLTLDGFMREMWGRHGRPEVHYRLEDIRAALAEYTGNTAFARDFFARYVTGRDVVDYAGLLASAGVLVRPPSPGAATVGPTALRAQPRGVSAVAVRLGTPLYEAGLGSGDLITSLDGVGISSPDRIAEIASRHRPGDVVPITFESRGRLIGSAITFAEDPRLEVLTYEEAGLEVTDAMRRLRGEWWGPRAGS
jgi:predicted metalloprotease with PDZ domain